MANVPLPSGIGSRGLFFSVAITAYALRPSRPSSPVITNARPLSSVVPTCHAPPYYCRRSSCLTLEHPFGHPSTGPFTLFLFRRPLRFEGPSIKAISKRPPPSLSRAVSFCRFCLAYLSVRISRSLSLSRGRSTGLFVLFCFAGRDI